MPIYRGQPATCGDCNGTDRACRCCQYGTDAKGNALPKPVVSFAGSVEDVKAQAPNYATSYPHRFYLDGVLVHEQPAPKKACRK